MNMFIKLAALLTVLPACISAAEPTVSGWTSLAFSVDGGERAAGIYVPPGYDQAKTWPLIVYLHGGTANGDTSGPEFAEWLKGEPLVQAIDKNPERFPALVLIPRCPPGRIWAPIPPDPIQSEWRLKHHGRNPVPDAAAHITRALDAAMKAYSVNSQRVTLTGYSMGGEGATRYAALDADRIAGVAPLAGSAVIVEADAPILSRLGVWMFQGETDEISTTPLARRMVAALRAAGGVPRYTEYEGVGHDFADRVYSNAEVIQWILNQNQAEKKVECMRLPSLCPSTACCSSAAFHPYGRLRRRISGCAVLQTGF